METKEVDPMTVKSLEELFEKMAVSETLPYATLRIAYSPEIKYLFVDSGHGLAAWDVSEKTNKEIEAILGELAWWMATEGVEPSEYIIPNNVNDPIPGKEIHYGRK